MIARGFIRMQHIPGKDNCADILTKYWGHSVVYPLLKPIFHNQDQDLQTAMALEQINHSKACPLILPSSGQNPPTPIDYEGIHGETAWILITDHFTGMKYGDTRISKAAPLHWLDHFFSQYNPYCNNKYAIVDQGGELYHNPDIQNLFSAFGYTIYPTGADASHQNGSVERAHRTLANSMKTSMLSGANLPIKFWPFAFYHALRLSNVFPEGTQSHSPLELATGKKENLTDFRTFGCRVWVRPPGKKQIKLKPNARRGIFLGFVPYTTRNILWYDTETHRVKIATHVRFDEGMNDLPLSDLPTNDYNKAPHAYLSPHEDCHKPTRESADGPTCLHTTNSPTSTTERLHTTNSPTSTTERSSSEHDDGKARHFHSSNAMNYREYFQGPGPFGEAPTRHDVIHGLRRYPGTITQPSANRGRAFGYIDDVEGQEGELVQVDAALLSRASASRVYLMAHHEATIFQHPDREYIPAIPEGTAHTEMLQAHKVCFLPFEFVPLVLCRGLTPKQAFQVLQPHIHQQGLEDICKPLLDTLRAMGTEPTTLLGAIRLLEPGPSFRAEANIRAYMKKNVLLRDLPGLAGSAAPADPATLTAAFSALTDQQLRLSESLEQRRQESSKLHSVREVWGNLYTERLLLLCAWAKKSKHKKTHMVFQSQIATDAYNLGIQAPLITTAVLKRFQDCNFYGTDPFDVADSILPLAFTPPGGSATTLKREYEAAAHVAAYDIMISTQGNSLSLKDSLELQKTKAYIPLDWTEATTHVRELFRGVRIYFSRTNFVRDFNTAIFLDTLKFATIV
eukprot:jgi/Psemu1/44246/gm1.44246_g